MLVRMIAVLAVLVFAATGTFVHADATGGGSSKSDEYQKAVAAIKKKDYSQAVDFLEKAVEKDPKNADAWNYMGYSLRSLERYDDALSAYENALQLKPKHKGALEYLGELYLQTDQLEKAKAQLERLDDACFLSCKELRKLEQAIEKYEAG